MSLFIVTAVTRIHAASGAQADGANGQHLDGSWLLTAIVPGETLVIKSLITFTPDGSLIESHTVPLLSSAHGAWVRIGNRSFAITALYLRFTETGEFIGTSKVRATLELSKTLNESNGEFETDVFDTNGNKIDSFSGTAQATRIVVEPLS